MATNRKRPLRWRHIPGTIWGFERHELWRGELLFATVSPGQRGRGSSWWAGSMAASITLKRAEWSSASVDDSKAAAKAYVVAQLVAPGEPTP